MKEVNLEEILFSETNRFRNNHPNENIYTDEEMKSSPEFPYFMAAMSEACRQVLELASENAEVDVFGEFTATVNKKSITNTINQVK